MPTPALLLYFLCTVLTVPAEFVLRPKDPPSLIEKLETSPGQQLTLRCTTKSTEVDQKWVFRGVDLKEDHGKLTTEGTDSILTVPSFNPIIHAGVYECYEGVLEASVRVESDVGPPLPKGFRPCKGEENNSCERGSCGADGLNKISCFCPTGWSGSKCDKPISDSSPEQPNTDCLIWIIVGGLLLGCILVFSIILVTYFFCPVAQCKSKESAAERADSLLKTTAEEKMAEENV